MYTENENEHTNMTISELNLGPAHNINDLTKDQTAFETKYMNADFYEPVPTEIAK
jgi:hypothetical protein